MYTMKGVASKKADLTKTIPRVCIIQKKVQCPEQGRDHDTGFPLRTQQANSNATETKDCWIPPSLRCNALLQPRPFRSAFGLCRSCCLLLPPPLPSRSSLDLFVSLSSTYTYHKTPCMQTPNNEMSVFKAIPVRLGVFVLVISVWTPWPMSSSSAKSPNTTVLVCLNPIKFHNLASKS